MAAVGVARISLSVTPIAGALGAEVAGVDLGRSMDAAHGGGDPAGAPGPPDFFPTQELTPKSLLAFARCLGEPLAYPQLQGLPEEPLVIAVTSLEHERVAFGGLWHTDTSYLEQPPMGSLLYAVELPPYGGDTHKDSVGSHSASPVASDQYGGARPRGKEKRSPRRARRLVSPPGRDELLHGKPLAHGLPSVSVVRSRSAAE